MKTAGTTSGSERCVGIDAEKIRRDFPALHQQVHGKPLVYLDNAATTQKPQSVIDAIVGFYTRDCANIHRGVHLLSERATRAYEDARAKVRRFIHAADEKEIIFVRGATEGINLVAQSFARPRAGAGRRDPDFRDGAPFQHRAVADPVRADRRAPARSSP